MRVKQEEEQERTIPLSLGASVLLYGRFSLIGFFALDVFSHLEFPGWKGLLLILF